MTSEDVHERLGMLEQLVQYLYEKSGVSAHVRQLLAAGDKTGAVKAYRVETNVDLPTARRII